MVLPGTWQASAAAGMSALHIFYNGATGLWDTTGWWNSANALETTIDYAILTHTPEHHDTIRNTFEKQKAATNFLNKWMYDDEGWWALAWIKAYDLTGEKRYLDTAKFIFDDLKTGWDPTCRGGIWWNKTRGYKNAITTELFLATAARLHLRTPNDQGPDSYLNWAKRSWDWMQKSGLIRQDHLVNDKLNRRTCRVEGKAIWTYNHGVILGGLVDLYKATNDSTYLDHAHAIAKAAMDNLTSNGILKEQCEPNCGADGAQFKGIFMRNLSYLYQVTRDPAYKTFIVRNAAALLARSRNHANQFGLSWTSKFDSADAARQSAAIDVLNATIAIEQEAPNCQANSTTPSQFITGILNWSFHEISSMTAWNHTSRLENSQASVECPGQLNPLFRDIAMGNAFRNTFANGKDLINHSLFPAINSWEHWTFITVPKIPFNAESNLTSLFSHARENHNGSNGNQIAMVEPWQNQTPQNFIEPIENRRSGHNSI